MTIARSDIEGYQEKIEEVAEELPDFYLNSGKEEVVIFTNEDGVEVKIDGEGVNFKEHPKRGEMDKFGGYFPDYYYEDGEAYYSLFIEHESIGTEIVKMVQEDDEWTKDWDRALHNKNK